MAKIGICASCVYLDSYNAFNLMTNDSRPVSMTRYSIASAWKCGLAILLNHLVKSHVWSLLPKPDGGGGEVGKSFAKLPSLW